MTFGGADLYRIEAIVAGAGSLGAELHMVTVEHYPADTSAEAVSGWRRMAVDKTPCHLEGTP